MTYKLLLAGCFFIFSFASQASQSSIYFIGFGSQSTEQLCLKSQGDSQYVMISNINEKTKSLSIPISFNCLEISSNPDRSIEELVVACEKSAELGLSQDLLISQIDVDFLTDEELSSIESLKSCE